MAATLLRCPPRTANITDEDKNAVFRNRPDVFTRDGQLRTQHPTAVTSDDIAEAVHIGIEPYAYDTARTADATHQDILAAYQNGIHDITGYGRCRRAGATHTEILAAARHHADMTGYWYARHHGISHDELVAALNDGVINIVGYTNTRIDPQAA
jgi:hypothetical protein